MLAMGYNPRKAWIMQSVSACFGNEILKKLFKKAGVT
jgi:hypothetical protein